MDTKNDDKEFWYMNISFWIALQVINVQLLSQKLRISQKNL